VGKALFTTFLQGWEQCLTIFQLGFCVPVTSTPCEEAESTFFTVQKPAEQQLFIESKSLITLAITKASQLCCKHGFITVISTSRNVIIPLLGTSV